MLFRLVLFHLRETLSLRTLVFFLAVLLMTVFIFAAMPALLSSEDRISYDMSLSIVDPNAGQISEALVTVLSGMNGMGQVYKDDMETAQKRLQNNEILIILDMPDQLITDNDVFAKRQPITLWLNPRMPAETAIFVRALRSVADSVAGMHAAYSSFATAVRPLFPKIEDFDKQLEKTFSQVMVWALLRRGVVTMNETARMSTPYHVISSLLALLCMQSGLLLMAQAEDERKNGVNYRLALSRAPWFYSPLARGLAGLLWIGISLAPLIAGLKTAYPQARLDVIILAILGLYWITAALCQAAGYLSAGGMLALPGAWLVILVLLLLGGCIYPETLLPAVIKPLMPLSPAYFAYQTIYAGLQGKSLPSGALMAFIVMAGISAIILAISWRQGLRGNNRGLVS